MNLTIQLKGTETMDIYNTLQISNGHVIEIGSAGGANSIALVMRKTEVKRLQKLLNEWLKGE